METFPKNNIEPVNKKEEKIPREKLIAFAKEKPIGDSEVRDMLLQWMQDTEIPEDSPLPNIERVDVYMKHIAMQYRLGFISKQEALEELAIAGEGITESKEAGAEEIREGFWGLLEAVEDDTFEVLKPQN